MIQCMKTSPSKILSPSEGSTHSWHWSWSQSAVARVALFAVVRKPGESKMI